MNTELIGLIAALVTMIFTMLAFYTACRNETRKNSALFLQSKLEEEKRYAAAEQRIALMEERFAFIEASILRRLDKTEAYIDELRRSGSSAYTGRPVGKRAIT
ncbi:MAG: hypothetical protein PF588_09705 [Candidatus Kapabacteria bacterium]|jgi:hypothetical protein|nr:hypothetical protein [Candidatus Kapabacteria bacterium]